MSVGILMDEHVHSAITKGLRQRGVDVITAQEAGLGGIEDEILLDHATQMKRFLFSQDADFFALASQRQSAGISFAGVVYAEQKKHSISKCINDLEVLSVCGELDDFRDQVIVL